MRSLFAILAVAAAALPAVIDAASPAWTTAMSRQSQYLFPGDRRYLYVGAALPTNTGDPFGDFLDANTGRKIGSLPDYCQAPDGNNHCGTVAMDEKLGFAFVSGYYYVYAYDFVNHKSVWNWTVLSGSAPYGPMVYKGNVYVVGQGGLYCIDGATGNSKWNVTNSSLNMFGRPAIAFDTLFLGETNGLVAITTAGVVLWQNHVSPILDGSTLAVLANEFIGESVYVASMASSSGGSGSSGAGVNYTVSKVEAKSGDVKWQVTSLASPPRGAYYKASPMVHASFNVFIYNGSSIIKADATTGSVEKLTDLPKDAEGNGFILSSDSASYIYSLAGGYALKYDTVTGDLVTNVTVAGATQLYDGVRLRGSTDNLVAFTTDVPNVAAFSNDGAL